MHEFLKSRGYKPRTGIVEKCGFCGVDVYVMKCHSNNKRHFCGAEHFYMFLKLNSFNFPCPICGTIVYATPIQFSENRKRTCSPECRLIYKKNNILEKRKSYTKHQLDRLARYSKENEHWRKAVFARDDYTCQMCLVRGSYIEADHIKPWAFFPDLRFELSNGRTLCKKCHNKTKISYIEMRKLYT